MDFPGQHKSLWIATAPSGPRPPLERSVEADVAIVGAGIVGVTAAYLLAREGKSVVLVERGRILEGVTGKTTAKVTSQQGILYHSLVQRFGRERAELHVEASEASRSLIRKLVRDLKADARYVEAPSYVFTQDPRQVATLQKEADTARELGLPASFTEETELPFPVEGAVRFDRQAHFHPRRYLTAVANAAVQAGASIHEHTPVVGLDDGEPCTVTCAKGKVKAKHVLVTTNVPILDRAYFVTRMEVQREYALAFPSTGKVLKGMYVNCDDPRRSVRPYAGDDGPMLVVSGEKHIPGKSDPTEAHFEALAGWAQQHFDVGPLAYRWSTQDYYPIDEVPFIGRHSPTAQHTFTATGFRAWGMTQGTFAAQMLADLVVHGKSAWSDLYDPFSAARALKQLARPALYREAGISVEGLVGRRLQHDPAGQLAPGEGRVMNAGLSKVAVCRDRDGQLHALSAACSHMGCIVGWNTAEQSWDCPCHGSRFAPDGMVLRGPATQPLEPAKEPPAAART